jgi:glucose/mannose-6-phosphate isomerase
MTSPLDDAKCFAVGAMLGALRGLPAQCRDAWETARSLELPASHRKIDRIVVLGMGGSAIAGDLWRALLQRESAVPVFNVRSYDLPPFVDERTLVIASSFSGDTEEVLAAFEQALAIPCPKIAVTTGGQLMATARAKVPLFHSISMAARAAIGWGLMPLLAIGESLGLTQGVASDIDEAVSVLAETVTALEADVATDGNPAKQMAEALHETLPVVYGAGPLVEVARRWKTQLNESAKVWAFFEELPEIHHNAIIGYALPSGLARETQLSSWSPTARPPSCAT